MPADMGRRDFLRLTSVGAAGTAILGSAGCGGGQTGQSNGDSTLKGAYRRPITSLDPHGSSAAEQGTVLAAAQIYGTLVTRAVQKEGEIVPSLATEWSNPDPRTWVFTLREDATFHNGKKITGSDVKASLERLVRLEGPLAPLWTQLESVDAPDPHTVRITTSEPLGTMLSNLALLSILPGENMTNDDFFRDPVGSGPFTVNSFVPSQRLALSSYSKFWGGAPKVDVLEFPYMPETSARVTAIKTGEVDVMWPVSPDQVAQVEDTSGIRVKRIPSLYYWFNWFNCSREPFTDARVRRAMWHALDLKTIISQLFGESAQPARAPIPPRAFGYAPQEPYEHDPQLARRLLAESGYPKGFSTSVMWQPDGGPLIRQFAQTLISYWSKVGINVKGEELPQAQWLDRLLKLDWDMDLQTNDVSTGDADYTLGRLYTSEANRMGYSNKELDNILLSARTTTDQGKRAELYAQACKIIWEEAVGIYPADLVSNYALRSDVRGFVPDPVNVPAFESVSLGN